MRKNAVARLLLIFFLAVPIAGAQNPSRSESDPWAPIRFFVGTWKGTAEGQPGKGTVERSYEFVLDGQYLYERNQSVYPPQAANPQGEKHLGWSFFSYDRNRKKLVLRQFHDEGFVNRYVFSEASLKTGTFAFESESFENFSNQWRAREVYEVVSQDEFVETFYLAPPGKPYRMFIRNHFRRVK